MRTADSLTGRDLDRALAARVMGWTERWPDLWVPGTGDGLPALTGDGDATPRTPHRQWQPSSDRDDLAEVLRAVESRHPPAVRHGLTVILTGEIWGVLGWQSWADSWALLRVGPEAVCRAVLRAVTTLGG